MARCQASFLENQAIHSELGAAGAHFSRIVRITPVPRSTLRFVFLVLLLAAVTELCLLHAAHSADDGAGASTPRPKRRHALTNPATTPSTKHSHATPRSAADSAADATPGPKRKAPADDATPAPKKKDLADDATPAPKKKDLADDATPGKRTYAPPAIVEPSEIADFQKQPEKVQRLLQAALDLTQRGLTYTYGSADPESGGMDCSGAIYYILKQQGIADVPRDSASQYSWTRQQGQFFAVISRKAGGFEFSDLKPGDLLFWNGTYAIDRDPPVTHTMLYLGLQKRRNVPIMWGSSDGRSFDGKQRWGVSVFDFAMPKAAPDAAESHSKALFLGYAHIPGLH